MGSSDDGLLHFTGDAFLDQMPKPEAHLVDLGGRDGRIGLFIAIMGEHYSSEGLLLVLVAVYSCVMRD